jgi:hypothetical protein
MSTVVATSVAEIVAPSPPASELNAVPLKPGSPVDSLLKPDSLKSNTITLKNNQQMTCLSLLDNDYLKTPTVPDLLKTPTILGSPTKSNSSYMAHADELNTPGLCLSSCTPKNAPQAFFGDHEPLLTGNQNKKSKRNFIKFNTIFKIVIVGK